MTKIKKNKIHLGEKVMRKIMGMEADFKRNHEFTTLEQAIRKEEEWRKELQRIGNFLIQIKEEKGESHQLYRKTTLFINEIKKYICIASSFILKHINKEYQSNIKLQELIKRDEARFYHEGILEFMKQKGILNELFQKILKAIIPSHPKNEFIETRLIKRKFIIHCGGTNSGKTFSSLEKLKKAKTGIYLAPLRLMALEVHDKLNKEHVPCNLLTGEEEIRIEGAKHVSCTIEKANYQKQFDVAVIDEAQLIGDTTRGFAWTRAVLGIKAKEVHICCAPHVVSLLKQLIADCNEEVIVVEHERKTPLIIESQSFSFPEDVQKGDALIVFSRRTALQVASLLSDYGISSSVIYGKLPPETRKKQVELFLNGESDVVVSTDAIGMGLNLPIRRVVFLEISKYDGVKERPLDTQEIKQIAGRAGRQGMYNEGFINTVTGKKQIQSCLIQKDEEIKYAHIAPMEQTLFSLPFGTLKERLIAWSNHTVQVPYFEKMDISEMVSLLDVAEGMGFVLSIEQLYRAITIPFQQEEDELLHLWISYIQCVEQNLSEIPKPLPFGSDLHSLEIYYRSIGLYYAFGKTFGFSIDNEWVKKERDETSEIIHQVLKDHIHQFRKKCRSCGDSLPLEHFYTLCDECFDKRQAYRKNRF